MNRRSFFTSLVAALALPRIIAALNLSAKAESPKAVEGIIHEVLAPDCKQPDQLIKEMAKIAATHNARLVRRDHL